MDELHGVKILQNELEKSKGRLKDFNQSIKKLTGSEHPGDGRRLGIDLQTQRGRRNFGADGQDDSFSGRMGRGRGRIFGLAKRGLMDDGGPPVKRRAVGGAFSRLGPAPQRRVREESPEEDGLPKGLSVHSSVVTTSREAKNRQDIMQEQTKDKEGMQRNRRMFGLLLGTLNKFKTDSKTMETKDEQRKKIDQKLEENAEKEKKKFKQDTMQLMEERHLEETRINKLEQKMEVVEEHADIEREMKKLKCFLCTKAKPRIFWKPKEMNTAAENKLKDTVKVVSEMLKTSQDRLEKEIKDVMEREQKREERIKMRLREDGLFLDEENKEENGANNKSTEDKVDRAGDAGSNDEDTGRSQIKVKSKRRVVVEERTVIDSGSDSEHAEEVEKMKSNVKKEIEDEEENSKTGNESEDGASSDSGSNTDNGKGKDKNAPITPSGDAADKGKESNTGKNDKSDDDDDIQRNLESNNSRVVEYRESSKDKEKAIRHKAEKSESSKRDRHRDEHRSKKEEKHKRKEEKHSRHSEKRSRRDSEKANLKEEREVKEKRKHKAERTVVEED